MPLKRPLRRRGGANTTNEEALLEQINNKIEEIKANADAEQMEILEGVANRLEGPPLPHSQVTQENLFEEIGFLDPKGKNLNPLTGRPYENLYVDDIGTYAEAAENIWTKFPVYEKAHEIVQIFFDNQVILVSSGTGSGKTVLCPPLLINAMGSQAVVAVTAPKTKMTQEAAIYAAKIADVRLGEEIGYKYRGSKMPDGKDTKTLNRNGVKTRRIYATDGLILAKLAKDPLLTEFDAVIIDEVHERGVNIDILIMLLRLVVLQRPGFKLILMSATVDPKPYEKYFSDKAIKFAYIDLPGKSYYPVEEKFLAKPVNQVSPDGIIQAAGVSPAPYVKKAIEIVLGIMHETNKNKQIEQGILIFIPGKKDAIDGCMYLAQESKKVDFHPFCVELHSKSSEDDKRLATNATLWRNKDAKAHQRVIISTEVAESGITFTNLKYVIDTGLAKASRFIPGTAQDSLQLMYIAKSSHTQRKGRVGRTEPGVCYNVFTEEEYKRFFLDYRPPSIQYADITREILQFMSGPYVTHATLPFKYKAKYPMFNPEKPGSLDAFLGSLLTPPSEEYVKYSLRLLYSIGALELVGKDRLEVAPMGEGIERFSMIPPEMGKAIIVGYDYLADSPRHLRDDLIIIAALLEVTEMKMERLFESPPKTSRLDKAEAKRVMDEYRKIKDKHTSKYGDLISALEAYHTLMKIARPREEMTEEEKGEASKKASEYAKRNYMFYKKFKEAHDLVKDYRRDLDQIIRKRRDHLYYEKYHASEGTFEEFISRIRSRELQFNRERLHSLRAFLPEDAYVYPRESKESHTHNVLLALFSGFFPNYAQSAGPGRFRNCFPEVQTTAQIDRYSLVSPKKPHKHIFYVLNSNIEGRQRFNMITVISEALIKNLPEKEMALVKHCLTMSKKNTQENTKGKKKGDKKGPRKGARKGDKKRN